MALAAGQTGHLADHQEGVYTVVHGATAGTVRPTLGSSSTSPTVVLWVGSVEPSNAVNNDLWMDTTAGSPNSKVKVSGSFVTAGSGTNLPHHFSVNVFGPPKAVTNWSGGAALAGQWMGGVIDSTGAQNAEITFPVLLAAGTWSLTLLHRKFTDRGIYTVYLDGTSVGTIDGYNGSVANGRDTLTGLTVAAGHQDVRLVMATKNASSSSYVGSISAIAMTRTGS